jgi:hypothetical protein
MSEFLLKCFKDTKPLTNDDMSLASSSFSNFEWSSNPIDSQQLQVLMQNPSFRRLIQYTIELKQGKIGAFSILFPSEPTSKLINKAYLSILKHSSRKIFSLLMYLPKFLISNRYESWEGVNANVSVGEQDLLKVIMLFVGMNIGAFLSKPHFSSFLEAKDTESLTFISNKSTNWEFEMKRNEKSGASWGKIY